MAIFIILLQFLLYSNAEKDMFVYPTILQERTSETNLVVRLNDKFTLHLERSSVLADKLLFVTTSEEVNHLEEVETSAIQETLYHDTHYQSSVRVHQRDDTVKVEGIINHKLRIKPVPEGERSFQGQILHKIYEVKETEERFINMEMKGPSSNSSLKQNTISSRTSNGDVFQVELHIISDRKHQGYFDKNEDLIGYMAVFMNAEEPFSKDNGGTTDTTETLSKLEKYEQEGRVPSKHDALFLVTGLDLVKETNGKLEKNVAGRAFMGTVCSTYGVGVGEDTATTYLGVAVAAHELAHILGSDHDTTPRCPWKEGYLMSYVDGGTRKYRLSPCSEDSIRNTYGRLSEECKKVLSKTNYMSQHKEYPGETVREKYFCRKRVESVVKGLQVKVFPLKTPADAKNCKMQCCYWQGNTRTCRSTKMLERMACSKHGKTCKRGVCAEHEW
ncbi:venom metalloproteinase antarease TserMP_A-like isoform X2 [Dermacentor andersoni]|uniref:venom metalloproteinase antarease TserMP_A-like isoform X2 n=1 Tax=Dermacentor andersoni TaxID=34620 RepID=UPI002417C215|nr:venom metalloproteinase antarease TserMP_A-like isoform X2 [Dermacentor andersoni]